MGKKISCKKCGFEFEVGADSEPEINKEWTLVAPMPDKDGNVTITAMATWKCPDCNKTIRGSRGKTKGKFEGKSKKERLDEVVNSWEEVNIKEFAESLGVDPDNIEKVLKMTIKKGKAAAEVKNGVFVPDVDRDTIDEIIDSGDELVFSEVAESVGLSAEKVEKLVKVLIEQKQIYGELKSDRIVRDPFAEEIITEVMVGEKFELSKIAKAVSEDEDAVKAKIEQLLSENVIYGGFEEKKGVEKFNPH